MPTLTRSFMCAACSVAVLFVLASTATAADLVELLSGAKITGELVSRDEKNIVIKTLISGREFSRSYPVSRVHAVTVDGKREVLNEKTDGGLPAPAVGGRGTPTGAADPATGPRTRSKPELEKLIDQLGRTPPDWFDSTPLSYPQGLDLSFSKTPPGAPWNNQKYVGQYLWDIINPNPSKWREGVRLLHHVLSVNQGDPQIQERTMDALARFYHNVLEDYARAAFWWRQAGVDKNQDRPESTAHLADCYFKLGNKQMAVDLLNKGPTTSPMIKVWADMGETDKAIKLAEALAASAIPDMAYLYAADACRLAGRNPQAIQYYEKVLGVPEQGNNAKRVQRTKARAQASLEAIKLFALSDVKRVPDGVFTASSLGYEGQVAVAVTVRDKRIESVRVTDHKEKQFYSSMTDTPRKIIEKQGVKGVDATSSATITSEAIINATAKALAGAAK